MAKAHFHKNQRVFVRPVGTWALVERVVPHWTKGLDEPIRVFYDVGLGREFSADELEAEQDKPYRPGEGEIWRVLRQHNRWQRPDECAHHPHPGTYPVVVTAESDWGGWRVPGAEYDLDPDRVEAQARLIAQMPALRRLAETLVQIARLHPDLPAELGHLAREAREVLAEAGSPVEA
ncbi:MAG: hypothetical protein HXY25_00165, partial [Alphaproteobacteria bacterium]|nr:hypothetical protein [Alphaproteobacteria bacterium]